MDGKDSYLHEVSFYTLVFRCLSFDVTRVTFTRAIPTAYLKLVMASLSVFLDSLTLSSASTIGFFVTREIRSALYKFPTYLRFYLFSCTFAG